MRQICFTYALRRGRSKTTVFHTIFPPTIKICKKKRGVLVVLHKFGAAIRRARTHYILSSMEVRGKADEAMKESIASAVLVQRRQRWCPPLVVLASAT